MEQPFSTSKVTVEYFDPHGLYRLLSPGLLSRLPLRHLHWQSHSGPLRSIDTLHVELVPASANATATTTPPPQAAAVSADGFQTAQVSGGDTAAKQHTPQPAGRRHQIPGLRRTPYLKVLLVRCDDTDTYKSHTRAEIREWVKSNAPQGGNGGGSSKKTSSSAVVAENHDAYEWMLVHVVLPNSAAYAQPRTSKPGTDGSNPDLVSAKSTSRWGKSSSTLLERLKSDFNSASSFASSSSSSAALVDRVAQIRVGLDDVPYEMLPRIAAPAPSTTATNPAGYVESDHDAQHAWDDLVDKFKSLILTSFDVRVSQYEDDIREKDVQRSLPGWNFCTFFILKEGLARGFESVGLVEDALVGYDELSVGLDTILKEQQQQKAGDDTTTAAEAHGGALLSFTDDLKRAALLAIGGEGADGAPVDLQADNSRRADIPIGSTKKPYRDLILANNVSVFDFRCYIFARQIALLLRLGNAWSTREELLTKLKEQQESTVSGSSTLPSSLAPTPRSAADDAENLSMLAEICRRTLEFVPAVSQVMREDLLHALSSDSDGPPLTPSALHVIDNTVASFAFSVAQQILAQTATRALPIPPSTVLTYDDTAAQEPKASIPELKTMMHPARTSSRGAVAAGPPPPSPGVFPGPGLSASLGGADPNTTRFLKTGLEELAARRADLYMLSRSILQKRAETLGWSDGWSSAPIIHEGADEDTLEDVSLDDDGAGPTETSEVPPAAPASTATTAGIDNLLLRTALQSSTGFFRLYEALTDKSLRHFTVADHAHAVHANLADLAVLKYHLQDYAAAAPYFYETTPFFGEASWSLLELSMLLMYARCLKAMGRNDDYAWRLLKFLSKAAEAERQRRQRQRPRQEGIPGVKGCLGDLLQASTETTAEMRVPLSNFFRAVKVEGPPVYADGQDSFAITLRLDSLLADVLPVDSIKARIVQHAERGPRREIWLETRAATSLGTGSSTVTMHSQSVIPGIYEIDQIRIASKNLVVFHDQGPKGQGSEPYSTHILNERHIILYQRTDSLDVQLATARDLQLDKNNCLELSLLTGWNEIQHCEMRIRAATGGLRLLTAESKVVGSDHAFARPIEGGVVRFGAVAAGTTLTVSFPFSIELDVLELCVRVDVTYATQDGTFSFSKAPSVSTALALGVNVQDVFKHSALFSRFTVSTATASPLRVFRSELLASDMFTSDCADQDGSLPMVFPKQPVSLLYKITRKAGTFSSGARPPSKAAKLSRTMYIKLHYGVFQDHLDDALQVSLGAAFRGVPALQPFAKQAVACVLRHVHATLSAYDLEKVALLNEMATAPVLASVNWAKEFPGMGGTLADDMASVIAQWQKQHATLSIPLPDLGAADSMVTMRTILIPVEIPSITIVHTVDIQLQGQVEPLSADRFSNDDNDDNGSDSGNDSGASASMPIFCVNQLLPATLQLKWTRIWDTADADTSRGSPRRPFDDLEFSFEVTAPMDAWLIGGRRKGHFVIPAPDPNEGPGVGLSSTSESEATIPLVLIPLREGRLPYPSVDIREVIGAGGADGDTQGAAEHDTSGHHCETDFRNLGETVHVVADRTRVTLSLDASGPGGGPLVLESERANVAGRLVV